MNKKIAALQPGSVAEKHGISVHDEIVALNGRQEFDIIDFLTETGEDRYELTILRNGKIKKIRIKNPSWDPSGISFEEATADEPRRCCNQCIFCFMDQMPAGMRQTLYFKDDDYRLSFLCGNYITLTNVSDSELDRIIQMKLSPMNISVHTTDPQLRVSMIRNQSAGNIFTQLQRLSDGKIDLNLQLVLCPRINDGEALRNTLDNILSLSTVQSLSCVPVGLTKYRDALYQLTLFTEEQACAVIDVIEEYRGKAQEKASDATLCASDEFFLLAKREFPPDGYYGDYIQYENGVGMCRSFIDEIDEALSDNTLRLPRITASIVTGALAYPVLQNIAEKIHNRFPQCKLNVLAIKNNFFGDTITVAGLICGSDIVHQIKPNSSAEPLIIPSTMLKEDEEVFLDNMTLSELRKHLNVRCIVSAHSGNGLIETLLNWEDQL